MIDTIVMNINEKDTTSINLNQFTGLTTYNRYKGSNIPFRKSVRNATKEEKLNYEYVPQITLIERYGIKSLRIQFSVPKLLYGNNLDEIEEKDFDKAVTKLWEVLYMKNICVIPEKVLANTELSSVHFSKNIILPKGLYPQMIINQIHKQDFTKVFTDNTVDYRNGGSLIKYRTNKTEYVLYDKVSDINQHKKSPKKSEDFDKYAQPTLFDIAESKKTKQVLRIEIRLNGKREIKNELSRLGLEQNLSFRNLCTEQVSKGVLLRIIEKMHNSYLPILGAESDVEAFIADFMINNPKAKPKDLAEMYGYQVIISTLGTRGYRTLTEEKYGKHSWYRTKQRMGRFHFDQVLNYNYISLLKSRVTAFEKTSLKQIKNEPK